MTQVPSVRQALVGSMLRRFREARGYSLDDAARILECDRSKISRVETGQRGIRPKELRELLTEYGVGAGVQDTLAAIARPGGADGWWKDCRGVLPEACVDFIVAEGVASRVRVYAPLQVPELLWTPDYGLAVAAADPAIAEGAEGAAVDAVIAYRGAVLFGRQPECTVILGEAALRRQAGEPAVMRAQLARLVTLSGPGYPWLAIRVLPFAAGLHAAGGGGPYSVLGFSEIPDLGLVHVPGPQGGICLSEPSAVDAYTRVFDRLSGHALNPEQSALKLRELARCR